MKQLFSLYARVDDFLGHDNVPFVFFVAGRKGKLGPYEQLIKNFDPNNEDTGYQQGFVDEMFTTEEMTQAIEYLTSNYGTEITVKGNTVPIDAGNYMPTGAIPVGGPTGFLWLEKDENYSLPFAMWVYYDLRSGIKRQEDLTKKFQLTKAADQANDNPF